MALTNPKIFGLKIGNKFTDVENRRLVLRNLRIPEPDLDIIRGSQDASGSRGDFINFSRLSQPIYRTLDRYYEHSKVYDRVVIDRASISTILFGNLTINGRLDGSAIRYRYLDGTTVKIADISTSRVSAWSSSDLRATSSDLELQAKARISYGAQVRIRSSGSESILQFGTQSDADGIEDKPRLQTSLIPQEREFDAEIPTHKIKIKTSASNTIELYAMKGIPLIFEGQFRNLTPRIRVIPLSGGIEPSWKIKEVNNPNAFINFTDVLSGTYSQITFNSGSSKARFVQFYYPSDNIREIFLRSAGLTTLPVAKLSNLRRLDLENNKISTLPNLNDFATSSTLFKILNLRRNNLHLSEIPTERKLNAAVLNKIPSTVEFLTMGSTFYGSISDDSAITASDYSDWYSENTESGVGNANASIIFQRFPNIKSLNLQRYGSKQFFHADTDDPECHIPNISDKCTTYNIYRNNFRGIAGGSPIAQTYNSVGNTGTDNGRSYLNAPTGDEKTIKTCTSLTSLQLSRNFNLTDESFGAPNAIASDNIKQIRITFTNLPLPNVSNKPELEIIEANHTRNAGHIAFLSGGNEIYKFDNCNKLNQIYISNSNAQPQSANSRPNGGLHGNFPTSFTNPELQIIRMENVRLEGGTPGDNGTTDDTFPSTLFQNTPILREIRFSSSLFRKAGIGNQLFAFTPVIEFIRISSNRRITGNLPNIGSCSKLRYLDLRSNNFDGPVYSLASNESLRFLYLNSNNLSGDIPAYDNLPLMERMKLNNNKFTKLLKFGLPNLREFRCHINEITGTIPTFADCPKLKFLTLYSNKLSNYTPGALAENYSLRLADFSNNQLQQASINNIVNDIYTNFENSGSSRSVLVNLRNNPAQPSGESVLEKIEELKKIGWQILT